MEPGSGRNRRSTRRDITVARALLQNARERFRHAHEQRRAPPVAERGRIQDRRRRQGRCRSNNSVPGAVLAKRKHNDAATRLGVFASEPKLARDRSLPSRKASAQETMQSANCVSASVTAMTSRLRRCRQADQRARLPVWPGATRHRSCSSGASLVASRAVARHRSSDAAGVS